MTQIMKVAVLGSGQMGSGIAQVAAAAKKEVILYDNRAQALRKAKEGIQASLSKLESKSLLKEKAADIFPRIKFAEAMEDLKTVDCVIEAVTENFQTKVEILKDLSGLLRNDVLFASNTSSISITRIGSAIQRQDRFIGMHFMNPVPLMKLVEIIPGLGTSVETKQKIRTLAEEFGKVVVESQDRPGFIVNRVLMPMINEAIFALQENLASAEDIDEAMKLGTNQPMGPLALADFIGLDTCLFIMEVIHEGIGESKYRPAPLLRQYVDAGWLGKKSGRGFYRYESL